MALKKTRQTRSNFLTDFSAEQKAAIWFANGTANGQRGNTKGAIADYTRVIEMAGVPAAQKAWALVYRGHNKNRRGNVKGAIPITSGTWI